MADTLAPTGPCGLCGAAREHAFATTDRNRGLSDVRFVYLRCVACGTYQLENVPADLTTYYPVDYYAFPDRAALRQAAAAASEQAKLAFVRQHVRHGRLVEIGPGGGEFCVAAREAGFEVTAIEMDAAVCAHLEQTAGVPTIHSDDPEGVLATVSEVDVIVLWHVLEHLPQPASTIAQIARTLRPGGVLALAAPNPQSLQFRLLRGRWAHVDAPRHLFLLPLSAVAGCGAAHGLRMAAATTTDPAGRHWNEFGWEYALRRVPAKHPSTPRSRALARALSLALRPLEGRSLAGCAYTAVLVKDTG